ncbi:hypothetical protein A3C89_00575 [Candidatus Kaiserbacteria bacterium RIFCSPHIGHO2_02_FULL_50_50]|uniref:DUF4430 domain-containing protein n=1 Tax=Candidatus Kaiserbacteria bacterium RIFCSPHIGHO2_02_FULL_50_50 TaxID=1798492 RepID=A0A1F6DFZ5_9BACT|nr:MAG: hypothetical protein A3C89_00575 [Candidatus Kaiserbacteria bacterium RIFCSPHIGHO2_02_FULL_50_50]OGG88850.1 MAG: hypothetical protein A3G62_03015 [Candidatus Kaiserbacteria bacterium RIFCSPLOWO2_12_FULL_50_10]
MKKIFYSVLGVGILATPVIAAMAFTKPSFPETFYADTNVLCLPRGHRDLEIVWKMQLTIMVDGVPETVPHNIGNTMACVTELHTHEAGGVVYAEFYDEGRAAQLTFADFFAVWGESLEREGYTYTLLKGSEQVDSLNFSLAPAQEVTITYTSSATSTSSK